MKTIAKEKVETGNSSNKMSPGTILRKTVKSQHAALAYFFILILLYFFTLLLFDDADTFVICAVNIAGPLSLFIATSMLIYNTVRQHSIMLWTPYTFFLASAAVFFGLGPLVTCLGNESTIAVLQHSVYGLDQYGILRANLLAGIGITSTLCCFHFFSRLSIRRKNIRNRRKLASASISPDILAASFLVIGGTLRFLVILPYEFGLADYILPGIAYKLSNIFNLGLALSAYLSVTKGRLWTKVLWVLLPFHLVTVLLQFSKENMVLALLLPGLGAYLAHRNLKKLALWGASAIVVFSLLQPLINFGRGEIFRDTGTIRNASLIVRYQIVAQFLRGERIATEKEILGVQSAWLRINYSNKQSYVMTQRDQGITFDTVSNILFALVPRFIWPDKPVAASPGIVFYEYITDRQSSSVGITVYADAYWNFGWPGVVLVGAILGAFFSLASHWTLFWLGTNQLIFLPAILQSLYMALRSQTSFIVNGIVWSSALYFTFVLFISAACLVVNIGRKSRK